MRRHFRRLQRFSPNYLKNGNSVKFQGLTPSPPKSAPCKKVKNKDATPFITPGDDNLGYDFEVIDLVGMFGQEIRTCFLEVKATTGDGSRPFRMSLSEWLKAEECEAQENLAYIIVLVAHVTDAEKIAIVTLLENPTELLRKGELAVDTAGFYVWHGKPL